jgi:hypothetical protein
VHFCGAPPESHLVFYASARRRSPSTDGDGTPEHSGPSFLRRTQEVTEHPNSAEPGALGVAGSIAEKTVDGQKWSRSRLSFFSRVCLPLPRGRPR